jgi:hypothetical protein
MALPFRLFFGSMFPAAEYGGSPDVLSGHPAIRPPPAAHAPEGPGLAGYSPVLAFAGSAVTARLSRWMISS